MNRSMRVDELLATTRSVQRRLDYDRPVDRRLLIECLDLALQAPTAANEQRWHWVFVTEAAAKNAVAEAYRATFAETAPPGIDVAHPDFAPVQRFMDRLHEVPVMLIPCYEGRVEGLDAVQQAAHWASILPAVWSFLLALRTRGLGGRITTLHLGHERDVAAAVGIPFDTVAQACMLPIAHTIGSTFRRAPRRPPEDVAHWDTW